KNWLDLRELVPEPEIPLVCRVLTTHTLMDHIRVLTGPRRKYLIGSERNALLMSLRYFFRALIFNRVTVPCFWLPVIRRADHSPWLANWMHTKFYRGVFSYHFCRAVDAATKVSLKG